MDLRMLSKPFLVLYFSVLVATMGISLVSPILPIFAKDLGATGILIGLTFGVFAITSMVISPFVGMWSDRYGQKPFIILGLLVYLIAALGYLISDQLWQVIAFRAFSGVGGSLIFSVARAYLGLITPEGYEGRWTGVFSSADIIGFGTGPLIAGWIRQQSGFDLVFMSMAVLMGFAALAVLLFLPSKPKNRSITLIDGIVFLPIKKALQHRIVLALTLNWAIISLTWGTVLSFLGLRLENLGVSATAIGLVFALESFSSALTQPFFGIVVDRVSRRYLNMIGILLVIVFFIALGFTENLFWIYIMMIAVGASLGLAVVSLTAMQVDVGRKLGMGTVIGINQAGMSAGVLFGALFSGLVVDLTGRDNAFFFFAAFLMFIGLIIFYFLSRTPVGNVVLK